MFQSYKLEFIIKKIGTAINLALIPIILIMFFEKKTKYYIAMIIGAIIILANQFATGGRIQIIIIAISLMLCLSIYKTTITQKNKKKIYRLIIASVLIVLIITILRKRILENGRWNLIFENIYKYFTLCVPLSDYWIKWVDSNNYMTYGIGFFSGIIELISPLFNKIFGSTFLTNTIQQVFSPIEKEYIEVFFNAKCNAYVTWIFFLYTDFREIGVFLGSVLFGMICGVWSKKVFYDPSIYNATLYILLSQSVVKSFVRWEFSVLIYILSFIILRLCLKKSLESKEEIEEEYIIDNRKLNIE